jgi:opacity protein-like surface antigen
MNVTMKKTVLILLFAVLTVHAFSQVGDLTVGLKEGYATYYKNMFHGFDVAYNLTGSLEIAFTGLMNPNISYKDTYETAFPNRKFSVYSGNLDARLYLITTRSWGIGPALGGQYYSQKETTKDKPIKNGSFNVFGFNIGVHGKINITDNLLINGGWRYTNAKNEPAKYSLFYLGVAYAFQTQ